MKTKTILMLIGAICLAGVMSGCSMLANLQMFRDGEDQEQAEPEGTSIQQPLAVAPEAEDGQQQAEIAPDPAATRQVTLYFISADGSTLQGETRSIAKQEGIARATINELIAGPVSADLDPSLPPGVILEDIDVSEGVCTVDFSGELLSNLSQDPQTQLLALYSIVDTLTQFETVDSVRLLVDGQVVQGGLGGVDVTQALAPVSF